MLFFSRAIIRRNSMVLECYVTPHDYSCFHYVLFATAVIHLVLVALGINRNQGAVNEVSLLSQVSIHLRMSIMHVNGLIDKNVLIVAMENYYGEEIKNHQKQLPI